MDYLFWVCLHQRPCKVARDYRHGYGRKPSFQRKSQQRANEPEKNSSFFILGVGALVSLLLVSGFFVVNHFILKGVKSSESTPSQTIFKTDSELKEATEELDERSSEIRQPERIMVNEVVVPESQDRVKQGEGEVLTQNHYSFYQGLSQTEVVVEAELISVELAQPYYIQAGSFGSEKAAMQEKKRLEKHGQILDVSALTKGSRTYYRLRVGPFTDRLKMNKRRNELRKLGVDTLLIKAPKG